MILFFYRSSKRSSVCPCCLLHVSPRPVPMREFTCILNVQLACERVRAHTVWIRVYRAFDFSNKQSVLPADTTKVMMMMIARTLPDLMITQQLSLMVTVMLPLFLGVRVCVCVCVCACVCVCVCTGLIFFIHSLDSRAKRCAANLCKNVRCACMCVCVCVCVCVRVYGRERERESVDYTLLSNTKSRHFSSVCNYSEHTAS